MTTYELTDDENLNEYFKHSKKLRLETFKNWPFRTGSCTSEKMAEAGWYHKPTKEAPDATQCFFCFKELEGWEKGDNPWEEHKKHSPSCNFLKLDKPYEQHKIKDILRLEMQRSKNKMKKIKESMLKEINEIAEYTRTEMEKLL